mgnify:CR=1 FL=1
MNWNEVEIVKSIFTFKNTLTACPETSGKMIKIHRELHLIPNKQTILR